MYACMYVCVYLPVCELTMCVILPECKTNIKCLDDCFDVCVYVVVWVWFCLCEGPVPRAQMMFFLSVIPSQVILLADILPTLLIKSTAPFYIQRIPYR